MKINKYIEKLEKENLELLEGTYELEKENRELREVICEYKKEPLVIKDNQIITDEEVLLLTLKSRPCIECKHFNNCAIFIRAFKEVCLDHTLDYMKTYNEKFSCIKWDKKDKE